MYRHALFNKIKEVGCRSRYDQVGDVVLINGELLESVDADRAFDEIRRDVGDVALGIDRRVGPPRTGRHRRLCDASKSQNCSPEYGRRRALWLSVRAMRLIGNNVSASNLTPDNLVNLIHTTSETTTLTCGLLCSVRSSEQHFLPSQHHGQISSGTVHMHVVVKRSLERKRCR